MFNFFHRKKKKSDTHPITKAKFIEALGDQGYTDSEIKGFMKNNTTLLSGGRKKELGALLEEKEIFLLKALPALQKRFPRKKDLREVLLYSSFVSHHIENSADNAAIKKSPYPFNSSQKSLLDTAKASMLRQLIPCKILISESSTFKTDDPTLKCGRILNKPQLTSKLTPNQIAAIEVLKVDSIRGWMNLSPTDVTALANTNNEDIQRIIAEDRWLMAKLEWNSSYDSITIFQEAKKIQDGFKKKFHPFRSSTSVIKAYVEEVVSSKVKNSQEFHRQFSRYTRKYLEIKTHEGLFGLFKKRLAKDICDDLLKLINQSPFYALAIAQNSKYFKIIQDGLNLNNAEGVITTASLGYPLNNVFTPDGKPRSLIDFALVSPSYMKSFDDDVDAIQSAIFDSATLDQLLDLHFVYDGEKTAGIAGAEQDKPNWQEEICSVISARIESGEIEIDDNNCGRLDLLLSVLTPEAIGKITDFIKSTNTWTP